MIVVDHHAAVEARHTTHRRWTATAVAAAVVFCTAGVAVTALGWPTRTGLTPDRTGTATDVLIGHAGSAVAGPQILVDGRLMSVLDHLAAQDVHR